jgi:hypothetical protein
MVLGALIEETIAESARKSIQSLIKVGSVYLMGNTDRP